MKKYTILEDGTLQVDDDVLGTSQNYTNEWLQTQKANILIQRNQMIALKEEELEDVQTLIDALNPPTTSGYSGVSGIVEGY